MAKHDRRKTSGRPPSSRPVTIQVPLPVLGVVNGVREAFHGSLEHDHPGAAASIREGLDETLTVQRLGLTGALQRTLRTTNIIENLNGSVEHYSRNVKRWRGGQMIQRWVASALVEAEKHFRRVRGYRDLQHLVGALDALAPPDGVVADVA